MIVRLNLAFDFIIDSLIKYFCQMFNVQCSVHMTYINMNQTLYIHSFSHVYDLLISYVCKRSIFLLCLLWLVTNCMQTISRKFAYITLNHQRRFFHVCVTFSNGFPAAFKCQYLRCDRGLQWLSTTFSWMISWSRRWLIAK